MLGQILLTVSGIAQILGPFIADFNETHVKNPRWPPHAKFHNGQTMSLGLLLGLCTLYYTWRSASSSFIGVRGKGDDFWTAAIFGSLYWIAGLSAILYPGSAGMDPEFGEGFPQSWLFLGMGCCSWAGFWVEQSRMGEGKGGKRV